MSPLSDAPENTKMTMQGQLFNTYEVAKPWVPTPGATTWHKGERCIVIAVDTETYAQTMIRVVFSSDGREGIFKPSELGLTL